PASRSRVLIVSLLSGGNPHTIHLSVRGRNGLLARRKIGGSFRPGISALATAGQKSNASGSGREEDNRRLAIACRMVEVIHARQETLLEGSHLNGCDLSEWRPPTALRLRRVSVLLIILAAVARVIWEIDVQGQSQQHRQLVEGLARVS